MLASAQRAACRGRVQGSNTYLVNGGIIQGLRQMGNRNSRPRAVATAAPVAVPTDIPTAYEQLCGHLKEISALGSIDSLLGWDEMVMMPAGSASSRGAQKAVLAGVMHDKKTDPQIGALLKVLRAAPAGSLNEVQAAVVRDAQRDYVKETALPKELTQRIAKLGTDAYTAWVEARKKSDFSIFAPFLEQWVEVSKEKAKLIDPTLPIYDVLLDDYERGCTTARLDEVFTAVREGLVPLIADIRSKGKKLDGNWIQGEYDVDTQAALCNKVALDIGFNTEKGRLDVSVHPFSCGMHPTDVRMTTRFKKDDLLEGLTGAIHETGHSLYEQGRDLGADGLPVNRALSMGVHESQSLLWERMVGLGRPFNAYVLPLIQEWFKDKFPASATAEALYEAANVIKEESLIRVEADEVTYPLHIILRYEVERGLLDGSIKVADVPKTWNAKMKEYLGCTPADDAKGCLQDVHWSMGAIGYFPTYTLGAMLATQIYAAAKKDIAGLEEKLAKGDFKPLKEWLNEKIHKVGSLYGSADELMVKATGSPLDPKVFIDYIKTKYSDLYKL